MTWNQQSVKRNNKSLVLRMIKSHGPLSRADISQRLGLTKGTVSSLVNELLEEHLCYETGIGKSSGGRRPVLLVFNQTAGYSIGIDLGVNYILGVLTDLNGNVIKESKTETRTNMYEETILTIKDIIHFLLSNSPNSHYGVVGIGIGVPGLVNKQGDVLLAPNLAWKNVSLKKEIEIEFQMPVIIDNEANAGVYGEKSFGAGQNFEDIIYISAGIGIGVGLILNNEIYRGKTGFSGEIGHMIISHNGRACSCGSNGCWELYASEKALLVEAKKLVNDESMIIEDYLSLEYLLDLAKTDQKAKAIFQTIGHYLGIGISNIINTFNPEQVIIGNRLAMAKEMVKDPIKQVIEDTTLKQHQENLDITFAQLSIYSTALGISAFVTENFLKADLQ